MIGLFISFSVGLNVSIADLFGLLGLGGWANERWRAFHAAAFDHRQQHAVPAHASRAAHPAGRPDGGSPVIKHAYDRPAAGGAGSCSSSCLPFLSPNLLNAAIKMMIAALFALAFTLAMGQAGMLSFGHAAYYGLGAFAALHLMRAVEHKLFGFPTPLIPLAGALAGFVFGLAFGWFATQRTGVYFLDGHPGAGRAPVHACADLEFGVRRRIRHFHHSRALVGHKFRLGCRCLLSDARLVRGVGLVHVGVHENTGRTTCARLARQRAARALPRLQYACRAYVDLRHLLPVHRRRRRAARDRQRGGQLHDLLGAGLGQRRAADVHRRRRDFLRAGARRDRS